MFTFMNVKTVKVINSKEWKSQSSLQWFFGSIEKIDISIYMYQEWKLLIFLHTSKISNCKEWIFTLQRVKFQSVQSEIFNLFTECSISLDWSVFKFNKHKWESPERNCTEGTLYEKIENFTLKR